MAYALITGGSSGIGREYALQLAKRGYDIVVVSNREELNIEVASEVKQKFGVQCITRNIDLTRSDAANILFEECKELDIEILINNAGMLLFGQLHKTPEQRIDQIIALHCTTPTKLCRLFGQRMAEQGRGHILIMSSITAWTPYPTISHYAATKSYLKMLGGSLWYELRDRGVKVTTVFPSAVDTPLYNLDAKYRRPLLGLGLMLSAESVARKALKAMFKGRRRCLPGGWTKIEAAICKILPAWALIPVMRIPAVRRILERI